METGLPPTNPYVCGITIDTAAGPKSFSITLSSPAVGQWTIESSSTQDVRNAHSHAEYVLTTVAPRGAIREV